MLIRVTRVEPPPGTRPLPQAVLTCVVGLIRVTRVEPPPGTRPVPQAELTRVVGLIRVIRVDPRQKKIDATARDNVFRISPFLTVGLVQSVAICLGTIRVICVIGD